MRRTPDPIETNIPVSTKHRLVWIAADGHQVDANPDNLRKARWRSEDWMYDRFNDLMADLGFDGGDDRWNMLRQFVQMITHYDYMLESDTERDRMIWWLKAVAKMERDG